MFGEFYDFLLSKEIKESEIETLYGILRENDNIAGFKQTEIALAYLYSMVVASFGLNRVQQQLLRIIIRMMNLKNARL